MAVTIDWAQQLGPAEADAVLAGTCARFYGLDA
jgi:hypothetical protein